MKNLISLMIILSILTVISCDDESATITPTTSTNVGEMSLSWLGDYTSHPSTCDADAEYDAYYNTTEGKSYFCDGIDWRMLAQNGTDGADGADGINGTNGTDGIDGVDGKTIQVSDINDNLLGYSIDLYILFSPNGYLYYLYTTNETVSFGTDITLFLTTNCTGDGLVKTDTNTATRSMLIYDTVNDTFRKRRDTTIYSTTALSFASDNTCYTTNTTTTFYKYDPITRTDAGIPETITLPLVYEFK